MKVINPLNAKLNPIFHLLALLAHHILHVSRIRVNESIYWHGTDRISNCLNKLLHEVLGCAPATILIIYFVK
jgi:hypothetical protein